MVSARAKVKEKMCPYWYTVEPLKPYGKKLNIWQSNPVSHYSERIGGAIIALQNAVEVDIRLAQAIARYREKYPGMLSLTEVKQ